MPLPIITADERLAQGHNVKMVIFGPSGVGKTSQAKTLDPETTLFIDAEAGTLALGDWGGDILKIRQAADELKVHPWELARAIACVLCGPDPAASDNSPYSRLMYDAYAKQIGGTEDFSKYKTIFVDSITEASRLAFGWAQMQPEAMSEKTGKPDVRGAYGLLGREMMMWLKQLQHIPNKNVVLVGILDVMKDPDFPGKIDMKPQIEGSKAARELSGVFDQIMTIGLFRKEDEGHVFDIDKGTERAFICKSANEFGVPAKDRSGRLGRLESPNLAALLEKISKGERTDTLNTETNVTTE